MAGTAELEPEPAPDPGGGSHAGDRREASGLAAAITRAWRPYRWRGYVLGLVVGILVGGVLGPLVTLVVWFVLALVGLTIDQPLPWAEVVWSLVFALTFAACGAWAVARWLPRRFRAATESYLWLAVRAERHWHEVFGDRPVPRSVSAMRSFVQKMPETPETAGERFAIWLALGDLESTRRVIAQMPAGTHLERHARLAATWLADFAEGSDGDLAALRASADAIDDPDDRLEADVEVAVDAARVELTAGRDWKAPLVAVRDGLGDEPASILWQHAWRPAFRGMLAAAVLGVASFWFFLGIR